ncbi:jg21268, partial [Pararge aegeria aegeria]
MERKLLYMEAEMIKDKIKVVEHNTMAPKPLPLNEIATLE